MDVIVPLNLRVNVNIKASIYGSIEGYGMNMTNFSKKCNKF